MQSSRLGDNYHGTWATWVPFTSKPTPLHISNRRNSRATIVDRTAHRAVSYPSASLLPSFLRTLKLHLRERGQDSATIAT